MMKTIRRLLTVAFVLLVLVTALAVTVTAEEIASGTCGENLTWVLDDLGTLTISGTGPMDSWASSSRLPWSRKKTNIEKVVIEEGVTSIGDHAFDYCTNLQSITIPEGIGSIGPYAFNRCKSLQNITIPQSVTGIGYAAFGKCTSLQNVTIPDGVTVIEKSLFTECTSLQSVTIPDTITSIEYAAFYGCTNLQSFSVPDSVTNIDAYAFHGCAGFDRITVGKGVTTIGECAFRFCTGLEEVKIPDGITDIVYATFSGCTSLQNILLPDSVTQIEWAAFDTCDSLATVYYGGTEVQKGSILIGDFNSAILNADWKYGIKAPVGTFADIPETSWQFGPAKYACKRGLMAGKGKDGNGSIIFDPNIPISREEFVQVLYNAEGKPSVTIANKFPDVGNNAWYKNAVLWANENNIANGTGAGTFGVGQNISRQDLAMMLYKYAKLKGCSLEATAGEINKYADGSQVADYAKGAMDWAVTYGVLSGKGEKGRPLSSFNLDPAGTATRAECAAMLKNFMEAFGL